MRVLGLESAHPRRRRNPGSGTYGKPDAHRFGAGDHAGRPDRRRLLQQRVRPAQPVRLFPHLRAGGPGPAMGPELRGYHKPIMLAGGLGNIRAEHVDKRPFPAGTPLVVLGGPAMLIGLGGGAASSHGQRGPRRGSGFRVGAARQPGDAAPLPGGDRPLLGAGATTTHPVRSTTWGPADCPTPCRSWCTTVAAAVASSCGRCPTTIPACRPWRSGATRPRSATCWRWIAERLDEFEASVERERCPYAVVGEATQAQRLTLSDCTLRQHAHRPARRSCCSASRPRCIGRPSACPRPATPSTGRHRSARRRGPRAAPADGGGQELPHHHRRPHHHRPGRAGPDGGSLAGAGGGLAVTLSDYRGLTRRGHGDGRAHTAGPAGRPGGSAAWPSARPSPTSPRRASSRSATSSSPPTGWRRPDIRGRTPGCTIRCARSAWSCARRSASPSRWARTP